MVTEIYFWSISTKKYPNNKKHNNNSQNYKPNKEHKYLVPKSPNTLQTA